MSSRKRPDLLDLETDIPTTDRDVEALRLARTRQQLTLEEYIVTLERLTRGRPPERPRVFQVEPFEL